MDVKQQVSETGRKLGRGSDPRTPFYMHNAVLLTVAAFAAVVIVAALLAWKLS